MFYTFWPRFTCNQITSPLVYTEDMSIAQQIAHIFGGMDELTAKLSQYLTVAQFNEFLGWLDDELDEVSANAISYTDAELAQLEARINQKIADLTAGALIWDASTGSYQPSQVAVRDGYLDLAYRAYTVEQLNLLQLTVEQLANCGLNARGLAVAGHWLRDGSSLDERYLAPEVPDPLKSYTYDELVALGLAGQTTPTIRDYTVHDLANSGVRATGNVFVMKEEEAL